MTVHGFRSSFRNWCSEEPDFSREVIEASLAHVVAEKTEGAYFRSDVFDRFRANEVRLQLSGMAYNLGNLWRRLGLPNRIKSWSLTSLQHRLMKTGGRLVKHARYYWLLLAEGYLNRRLFGDMLRRIWALPVPGG